jgi:hypothetical protein
MLPQALCSLLLLSAAQAASVQALYKRLAGLWTNSDEQHVLSLPSPNSRVETKHFNPFLDSRLPSRPTGFVAFGDSYSAGIGTFIEGKENECRQGQGAYPFLINADIIESQGGANDTQSLQWLSCTGSVTEDVLSGGDSSQIDTFNLTYGAPNNRPDFATLSIGGNDLGFFDVMNACVFRFYSFYSGTCETALAASDVQINSPLFEYRLGLILTEILNKVHWEKRPGFIITVTGYTRFFNADTEPCNNESLGIWWGGPKLKKEVRQRMNTLVLSVNEKLRKTVNNFNKGFASPRVFFVDYDADFDGHRFCEPGVTEPDYNRTDTWFFLPGGADNAPGSEPHGPGVPPNFTDPSDPKNPPTSFRAETLSPFSPLVDPNSCLPRAQKSGDWGELAVCYMAMAKQKDPTLRLARDDFSAQNSMWYVPTYYGKTFHPVRSKLPFHRVVHVHFMTNNHLQRTLGHRVVRDKVYEVWKSEGFV